MVKGVYMADLMITHRKPIMLAGYMLAGLISGLLAGLVIGGLNLIIADNDTLGFLYEHIGYTGIYPLIQVYGTEEVDVLLKGAIWICLCSVLASFVYFLLALKYPRVTQYQGVAYAVAFVLILFFLYFTWAGWGMAIGSFPYQSCVVLVMEGALLGWVFEVYRHYFMHKLLPETRSEKMLTATDESVNPDR